VCIYLYFLSCGYPDDEHVSFKHVANLLPNMLLCFEWIYSASLRTLTDDGLIERTISELYNINTGVHFKGYYVKYSFLHIVDKFKFKIHNISFSNFEVWHPRCVLLTMYSVTSPLCTAHNVQCDIPVVYCSQCTVWHPRCVLLTMYNRWKKYSVVNTTEYSFIASS
jgi:hypothetical protein